MWEFGFIKFETINFDIGRRFGYKVLNRMCSTCFDNHYSEWGFCGFAVSLNKHVWIIIFSLILMAQAIKPPTFFYQEGTVIDSWVSSDKGVGRILTANEKVLNSKSFFHRKADLLLCEVDYFRISFWNFVDKISFQTNWFCVNRAEITELLSKNGFPWIRIIKSGQIPSALS